MMKRLYIENDFIDGIENERVRRFVILLNKEIDFLNNKTKIFDLISVEIQSKMIFLSLIYKDKNFGKNRQTFSELEITEFFDRRPNNRMLYELPKNNYILFSIFTNFNRSINDFIVVDDDLKGTKDSFYLEFFLKRWAGFKIIT